MWFCLITHGLVVLGVARIYKPWEANLRSFHLCYDFLVVLLIWGHPYSCKSPLIDALHLIAVSSKLGFDRLVLGLVTGNPIRQRLVCLPRAKVSETLGLRNTRGQPVKGFLLLFI